MTRGSDSTTAKSSTRPPMMAGPISRNFRFFSAASCAVSAHRPPAMRRNNATLDLSEFIHDLLKDTLPAIIRQGRMERGAGYVTNRGRARSTWRSHEADTSAGLYLAGRGERAQRCALQQLIGRILDQPGNVIRSGRRPARSEERRVGKE